MKDIYYNDIKKMKKNSIDTETPRTRGRPAGSRARPPAGLLHLTPAEIIDELNKTSWTATADLKAKAIVKTPKTQDGTNGKPISARVYCPAEWSGYDVLVIALTDQQARRLKAADLRAKAADLRARADNIENTGED